MRAWKRRERAKLWPVVGGLVRVGAGVGMVEQWWGSGEAVLVQ